ncbi:MAG: FtsK/SpoIIIE domain-containing protein [Aerococcus urinaeequi]
MLSGGAMGLIGVAKIAGGAGAMLGAFAMYRKFPDRVVRRKLSGLFRTGDIYLRTYGYKKREMRAYPTIKKITMYTNRIESTFVLPVGMDPDVIEDNEWIFKQVFGSNIELEPMDDARTFILRVYSYRINSFEYDPVTVKEAVKGLTLPVYVGRDQTGEVVYDMTEHPHLLIAGETGSGKSVAVRSILTTIIAEAGDRIELYCADLKMSEFHLFRDVATETVTEAAELHRVLMYIERELKRRGRLMEKAEVANVGELPEDERPDYIIMAIDEVALLKKEKAIMGIIETISAIGRALGVFLILSMQRPDATILDGKLKNNLTVRMGFRHPDGINSRISLDSEEAAQIKNKEKGRFAFKLDGIKFVQGPFLGLAEAKKILEPFRGLARDGRVTEAKGSSQAFDLTEDEWELVE